MGYHLKLLLNAENGGTSTQSEAFFPFQHAFHEKNLFSLVSAPECKKSPLLVDIHNSKKPLLVNLISIILIIHQI